MICVRVKVYGLSMVIKKELSLPENAVCGSVLEIIQREEMDPSILKNPTYLVNGKRAGTNVHLSDGDTLIILTPLEGG